MTNFFVQSCAENYWFVLPPGISGTEWHVPARQLPLLDAISVPKNTSVLHLGDIRGEKVGVRTSWLADVMALLDDFLGKHPFISKVVVHSESALGWKDGEAAVRKEFWARLASLSKAPAAEIVIENSIILNPSNRYDFVRYPFVLAKEISQFGLRMTLDVGHALVFHPLSELMPLVANNHKVGHLHLGDWQPSKKPNGNHSLPLGTGVLPLPEILDRYAGDSCTLEVGWGKLKTLQSVFALNASRAKITLGVT